jgi:hypothetical protein
MGKLLRYHLKQILGPILDALIAQELQKRGIPTKEEWEKILDRQKKQEEFFRIAGARQKKECITTPVAPSVLVEEQRCSLCRNPHFQGGFCLFHFHQ